MNFLRASSSVLLYRLSVILALNIDSYLQENSKEASDDM